MAGFNIKPMGAIAAAITQMRGSLYQAPKNNIRGVDADGFYSPGQPVAPFGAPGTEPRAMQFWGGQNLNYTPRFDSEYTAQQLREFSTYDLVRVVIENVKDVITQTPWEIHAKKKPGESKNDHKKREQIDPTIGKLTAFWECPDGENMWPDWVRPLLEDMLVIDAASVLIRKTFNGDVKELRVLKGDSITRYIDENGYTPQAPNPAYAQNWWGMPLVNLTTDQLVYKPRNIVPRASVSSQLYGMSPTEQAAKWIQIGSLRLNFQKTYYTDGAIPDVMQVVPPGATADKVAEVMSWMNAELAGNFSNRRGWRMVQGFSEDGKDQILFPKEALLTDPMDELIIRVLCFTFGTSPQRLMKMMNRASAEASQESADIEGYLPFLEWLRVSVVNYIIQRKLGFTDYEMVFTPRRETDQVKEMEALTGYRKAGVMSVNEVREKKGDDPSPDPAADELTIVTSTGAASITPVAPAVQADGQDPNEEDDPGTDPEDGSKPPDNKAKKKLGKRTTQTRIVIESEKLTAKSEKYKAQTAKTVSRWFAKSARSIGKALRDAHGGTIILKAEGDPKKDDQDLQHEWILGGIELDALHRDTVRALALLAWRQIDWTGLAADVRPLLRGAAEEGVDVGELQVAQLVEDDELADLITQANADAATFAEERSASLVGMKPDAQGVLIPAPGSLWALSELTRKDLVKTIEQAVEEGWTVNQLSAVIEAAYMFSTSRANLIAQTEMRNAQAAGTYATWLAAQGTHRGTPGKPAAVLLTRWRTTGDERVCDLCDGFEAQGTVPLGHEFAPGIYHPTAHPHCNCELEIVGY